MASDDVASIDAQRTETTSSSSTASEGSGSSSSLLTWFTVALVLGGVVWVLKDDVHSQDEWNERYGRRA